MDLVYIRWNEPSFDRETLLSPEEDRKERRRKLGLPEDLTEEEKKAEADKAEQQRKEEEARKKAFTVVKPVSGEGPSW